MDIIAILTSPVAGVIEISLSFLLLGAVFGATLLCENNKHAVNKENLNLLRRITYIALFLFFLNMFVSLFLLVVIEAMQLDAGTFCFTVLFFFATTSTLLIGIYAAIHKEDYDRHLLS